MFTLVLFLFVVGLGLCVLALVLFNKFCEASSTLATTDTYGEGIAVYGQSGTFWDSLAMAGRGDRRAIATGGGTVVSGLAGVVLMITQGLQLVGILLGGIDQVIAFLLDPAVVGLRVTQLFVTGALVGATAVAFSMLSRKRTQLTYDDDKPVMETVTVDPQTGETKEVEVWRTYFIPQWWIVTVGLLAVVLLWGLPQFPSVNLALQRAGWVPVPTPTPTFTPTPMPKATLTPTPIPFEYLANIVDQWYTQAKTGQITWLQASKNLQLQLSNRRFPDEATKIYYQNQVLTWKLWHGEKLWLGGNKEAAKIVWQEVARQAQEWGISEIADGAISANNALCHIQHGRDPIEEKSFTDRRKSCP